MAHVEGFKVFRVSALSFIRSCYTCSCYPRRASSRPFTGAIGAAVKVNCTKHLRGAPNEGVLELLAV